ncbi:MAG: PspA/IM30 family protein [Planctomycetaceae bacterium]|nr:PspA/IM30 family protein [Planctomycetaceae bacterium]
MSYFSRLTDIVTCNLSELLAQASDPAAALEDIIQEMQTGLEAAQRSVKTAAAAEEKIRAEIEELSNQLKYWTDVARQELISGQEQKARMALMRKGEVDDLIAGIKQQHVSAASTLEHLRTMFFALEARLADAVRRRASVANEEAASRDPAENPAERPPEIPEEREQRVEAELAALRREIGG